MTQTTETIRTERIRTETMTTTPPLTSVLRGLQPDMDLKKDFVVGTTAMTYGDLHDGVARTRGLFGRLGLDAGDRIAIVTGHDGAVSQLYGACLLSGVVAVVVDPEASASEVNVLLAKAKVSAVFADAEVIERASTIQNDTSVPIITISEPAKSKTGFGLIIRKKKAAGGAVTYPSMLADEATESSPVDLSNDAPALILFTSGTTSQPKGVVMTRGNMAAQLVTFERHYGYSSSSRLGNHLPMHHSDGLNQGVLLTVALGATLIRPAAVDMQTLGDMLDLLHRERGTHLITVPTVIAMMTRLTDDYDDVFRNDFEFISSTAGFLDEQIWRSVEERFNTMVVNSYGLTETVMEALYCGPTEDTRRPGTIGKPVDCQVRLVDDDGADVEPGEVGELWLRGENVMGGGYFELPEATAAVMNDGWLMTGDLAVCNDGFYTIAGRKKNVIIRAGINIYPEDVNSVLLGSPAVIAASTVGIADQFLGELVVSCVTLGASSADPVNTDPANELMALCRDQLANEKVPNRILIVDELPYGPSGKVELAKVTQIAGDMLGGSVAEGSTTAEQVLSVASRVFGQPVESLSPASTPDSTAGWDSLSFLELIVSLERQFDMSIAPRDVMTLKTLGDAIDLVENR